MTQRAIILTFVLGITAYVFAVFLWPSGNGFSSKTARLSGEPVVAAFLPERFGVPAPPQQIAPG